MFFFIKQTSNNDNFFKHTCCLTQSVKLVTMIMDIIQAQVLSHCLDVQ